MRHLFLFLFVIGVVAILFVRIRYGGGENYQDLTSQPALSDSALQRLLSYPEPIGNLAISAGGRIFFSAHPEGRPPGNKVLEWVDGAAVPYPSGSVQPHLFNTVLALEVDQDNRLWTLDHGQQGFDQPRLLAFDLDSGDVVHDHRFPPEIAPTGSFLQDLRISNDGTYVVIADGSIFGKRPALIRYDIATEKSRRLLERHSSLLAMDFIIRTSSRRLSYFGGIFALKSGISGLAMDDDERWLYYGAMNNDVLYRLPVEALQDSSLSAAALAASVEAYSAKPLSDGITFDQHGKLLVTDVEHNAVFILSDKHPPTTLIRSARLRWPASLAIAADGYVYVADSAFPELLLQTREHIKSRGPYSIFRFTQAGTEDSD